RMLAAIHERMPVIVTPDAFDFWLDHKVDGETAAALIAPAREDLLEAYEVSPAVNRVANDSADLIAPASAAAAPAAPPAGRRKAAKAGDDGRASLFCRLGGALVTALCRD